MVGIAVIAILMSAAMPSFKQWMLNTKIRTAAESVQNGLQRARAEAVARNANVAFTLTTPAVDSSWTVTQVGVAVPIESRAGGEGSKNVTVSALTQDLATAATTITFNSFGGVVANAAAVRQITFAATGSNQLFQVNVGTFDPVTHTYLGSMIRMCDPHSTGPSAC